jgi:hypothetical protein
MVASITAAATATSLNKLHRKSRRNRPTLAKSTICGCFYCLNEYPFDRISEWIENGETAICPCCGVDAVIGFDAPVADRELLHKMHERWFERSKQLTQEEWEKALERDAWTPAKSS